MAITPADDHFHDPNKYPESWDRTTWWWNESGWFNFHIPERDLSGIFYVHHRPLNNCLWAGTALWDPHGNQSENCLYYDWNLHVQPKKCDTFDFELPTTGFRIQCLEDLKRFHFTYDRDGFKADLIWEAFTPPQDQFERGLPKEWMEWTTQGHFEQFGHVTGEITIGGETMQVDDLSARDHSWGPHRMTETGRGTFTWGVADKQLGFFPYVVAKEPVPTDDIFDVVDVVKGGWYLKDGEIGTLVDGERRVERDEQGRPLREHLWAKDDKGRELQAEGEVKNHLFFQGFPEYWWWWCLVDWTVNGKDKAVGETQDAAIAPHWRRVLYDRNKAKREARV